MKICITSQGTQLDDQIDPRFGRAQYFIFLDTNNNVIDVLKNPHVDGMGGVGIQSAQTMSEKGVEIVITGNVGPNAYKTLQEIGIKIITGVSGTVKDAVKRYNNGEFSFTSGPTVDSQH